MRSLSTCALRVALFFVLAILVGAASILFFASDLVREAPQLAIDRLDKPVSSSDEIQVFKIAQGEDAQGISKRLEEQGLIRSATTFRALVTYYGVAAQLEAGEYELRPNMTTSEIISVLHKGLVKLTTFTIPEGWRLSQIADAAAKRGIFGRDEFIRAATQETYEYDFLPRKSNGSLLEGYLFPDTYRIPPSFTASDFINFMLKNFDQRLTPGMRAKAASGGLNIHQVVTLASIVEREAVLSTERPLIAGVFLNRLKLEMPLQADPTVQYALAEDAGNIAKFGFWKIGMTQADLEINSPYNTYRNRGLPPGPIANPGLASIQAVLEPVKSDYLYFMAKDDGSHAFAKTLGEHEQNVFRYRR